MSAPVTRLAGVCGWPVHHSLSPTLHAHWLREAGLRGAYVPFMVKPWEARSAFASLKRTTIAGVNVTLPLKTQAFSSADEATEDARRIGAANCLYVRGGRLIAHNTDLEGFTAPLRARRSYADLSDMTVLVVGAGGASRAVIAGLLGLGVPEIILCNRTDATAEALVAQVGLPSFYALPWAKRGLAVKRADLIVNASSAGMAGYPALDLSLVRAPRGALVYDLVYTPERTPLLADAAEAGLETIGGLDMLIGQARPAFHLFYGQAAPDTDPAPVLREALRTGTR
ncbi:shikimate dehydrogenase [uncultured Algimonas sp.]|uniref:shikimate dehydrogenase family protein n=1 Tax=uncultured Algimonas sp. TaxID=1547920 RepID=UPI002613E9B7|nr:shikimate dehydrogenase [uncultured Algimonas sp.]